MKIPALTVVEIITGMQGANPYLKHSVTLYRRLNKIGG